MTQPTHDEVKAWIDSKIEQIENESPALDPVADWRMIEILKASCASLLANRAVLERHNSTLWGTQLLCHECSDLAGMRLFVDFPCDTYTDIAAPIRSVME